MVVDAVVGAKALRLHHRIVAAVAGAARLRQKHVEVVRRVVAVLEAVPAYGHARRNGARAATVRDDVWYPNETAFQVIVISTNW